MTAKRTVFSLLVAGLVLLVTSANPRTKAGEGNNELQVAGQARILSPAHSSLSSSPSLTAPPCFHLGPIIELSIDESNLWPSDVAYNSLHDEYLHVWSKDEAVGTDVVWAARIGPDGEVRDTFEVAGELFAYYYSPAVAYSPVQDQYLVAYNLDSASSADVDVYAKRLSWDGGWQSNQFPIRIEAGEQNDPRVAYNVEHDEYLVVYWNRRAGGHEDIAAQRVRAGDGTLLSWRNIATGASEKRSMPDVDYNPARDEYLAVYDYEKGTTLQTRGSRFDYHMGTVYPEMVLSDQTNSSTDSRVAAGPNEYLVLWRTAATTNFTTTITTGNDIRGRRVSGDGIPQGSSAGFNIAGEGTTENFSHPDVAYSEPLGYLVAMEYESPTTRSDLVGRFVTPGHDSAAGELFPLLDFPEDQDTPHMACSPLGHCLIFERDRWDPAELNRWAIRGLMLGGCPPVFVPLVTRE